MTAPDAALAAALQTHRATLVRPLADTAAARVFVVATDAGQQVLKLYDRGHAGNEAAGAALMTDWAASGAMVAVTGHTPSTLVMPYLAGPTLGDLARDGADDLACQMLAETAARLHRARPTQASDLPDLRDWFTALFEMRCAEQVPPDVTSAVQAARLMAVRLFETAGRPGVPLHGDLHHDNVIVTDTGPVAFDAKGVRGPLGYELANALRNPRGLESRVQDPHRLRRCTALYARALGVDPAELAAWGAAKTALSIAWRCKGLLHSDRETGPLQRLVREAAGAGWQAP